MQDECNTQAPQQAETQFDGYVVDEHGETLAQFTGNFGF